MAKLNSLFKFSGTFQGVTVVHSQAYGSHIRKARTTFTLSQQMKASSAELAKANACAKAFKDAIDPYRRDFRDGQLWQRLVSLFKSQLKETGKTDWQALKGVELYKIHPLRALLFTSSTATLSENTLDVTVTTQFSSDPTRRADGYQLDTIVVFVDDQLNTKSHSEQTQIPLTANPGTHKFSCPIPSSARTAIIVVKCNYMHEGKTLSLKKGMGMKVVNVAERQ